VMERTNFRYLKPADLSGPVPDFATIDVSFISLKLILPPLKEIFRNQGRVVALVKPQFEAGKEKVGKSGVVRDPRVHEEVLGEILSFAGRIGFRLKGLTYSPIAGGEGNIEFLAFFEAAESAASLQGEKFPEKPDPLLAGQIWEVVREAHHSLANSSP